MPIYLMRHGRTRLTGTFCGSSNPPLTARGRAEARSAARTLSTASIDLCISSPQRRAQETARIVCRQLSVRLVTHPLLKEFRFGAWEGLAFREIEKKWPKLAQAWLMDPTRVRIPKAETFASLKKRVRRFLAYVKKQFPELNVLIVAHGGSLSAILLELLRLPNRKFPVHIQPLASIRSVQGRRVHWVHRPC